MEEARILEREAHNFLSQGKFEEAFRLFKKAGYLYKAEGVHKQSVLCFASAGGCWSKLSGEKTFYNSALSYQEAAKEAEKAGDYEYASLLYRYSAINYERDREFLDFSECFYKFKEAYRKFLTYKLSFSKKLQSPRESKEKEGFRSFVRNLFLWVVLSFSFILWGHGERPLRTFFFALGIIFLSAFLYTFGLLNAAEPFSPSFFQALYFSIITFTTVGFGDIVPLGFTKCVAVFEAFCGVFVIPLLVISLSRKYLRV